mmetsp:Transcript_28592/g.43751  ORF Transcript_28592/g.43751 Transcript_28592/m.43751 type:complete len:324 (-) Transcript_28592:1637-2608(-)
MSSMRRNASLHTFTMDAAFAHEDEGTAHSSAASVVSVMNNAKTIFPGIITAHQLARSLKAILTPRGFDTDKTLLASSFCCDEVCRDLEDELREVYGQNFSFGGIAGFPFGGNSAFGALLHHMPVDGQIVIVYGPHVGIDYDGVIGKVNRRGHSGSGTCCNTAIAGLAYVKAVAEGVKIHSPDASDPIDAQQVFVDSALMKHSTRLLDAEDPNVELPHVVFEEQGHLLNRIMEKCLPKDVPEGTKIALLGGIQVNTPEGTPEYFLPKKFSILNHSGEVKEDMLQELMEEGNKDIKQVIKEMKLAKKTEQLKAGIVDVPIVEKAM